MLLLSDTTIANTAMPYFFWSGVLLFLMTVFACIVVRKRRTWMAVRRKARWLEEDFIP